MRWGAFRFVSAAAAVCMLSTACSGVPNLVNGAQSASGAALVPGASSGVPGAPGTPGSGDLAGPGTGPGASVPGGPGASTVPGAPGSTGSSGPGTTTGTGVSPEGTGPGGTGPGGTGPGGTGPGGTGPGGTGPVIQAQGITDKYIKIVFHMPLSSQTKSDNRAAFGDRIKYYVKWFNKYVQYPGGRKLQYTVVDDGGIDPKYNDQARAAALKITKEIKPFASLGDSVNTGSDEPIVADATTRAGIIEIGTNFQTLPDLNSRAPYAWSTFEPGEVSMNELSWGIGKRFSKTQYVDDNGASHQRVWATVMFDDKPDHYLADSVTTSLSGLGVTVGKHYYVSGDTGTAAQQAASLAAQMQADGVNSVIFGVYGQPGVALTTAFDQAQYHPDWYVGSYGGFLGNTVFVPLYGKGFTSRLYAAGGVCVVCERMDTNAATSECPPCNMVDNGGAYVKAYHQVGGADANPQNACGCAYGIWNDLAILSIGLTNTGSVVSPQTFAGGVYTIHTNRCNVGRFWGRDHPQTEREDFYSGRQYGNAGMTMLYFVNKQNRFGTVGYFESYDNYYRFDSYDQLPAQPTWDTGKKAYHLVVQKQTINVDTSC